MDKNAKRIQEERIDFSINGARCLYAKKIVIITYYFDPDVTPFTKSYSKWTIDLQIKCKCIAFKLLEVKGVKCGSNYT